MTDQTPTERWEERYGTPEYVFGTEPNDFLRATVLSLPVGDALCIADGEGRNGVHLAELGHRVTSVDLSRTGLAKAARLAEERDVELTTVVADLGAFDFGTAAWDLIVSISLHIPPALRARIHAAVVEALRPGGHFVLEGYTPDQVGRSTGGPRDPALTMTLAGLEAELDGLEVVHGVELMRDVSEGSRHTGEAAVVQLVAAKPKH